MEILHKHHIIPRFLGGSDDPSNIIEVTPKEHYRIHLDRYLEYGHWQDLGAALLLKKYDTISDSEAILLHEARSEYMKLNNPMQNRDTALGVAAKKIKNGTCIMSYDNPSKKEANKRKASIRMKKDNPTNKNPAVRNNRNIHKECTICGVSTNPGNLARWHGKGKCDG